MIPRSFYFVRHGETDWNKAERMQGWSDIPLNETGRAQARTVAPSLSAHPIDVFISSPLDRAKETATLLNTHLKKPVVFDERLKERRFGILEGMSWSEADAWRTQAKSDPSRVCEANGYPLPDNAEPYEDFKLRIVSALQEHMQAYPEQNLIFVAHGGVYRALRLLLLGEATQSPNVQPYLFEKQETAWKLHTL